MRLIFVSLSGQLCPANSDRYSPHQFPGAESVTKLTAWVVFAVQVFEPLTRNVCIDLRRGEVTVPQE